jgi:hypothetical protein
VFILTTLAQRWTTVIFASSPPDAGAIPDVCKLQVCSEPFSFETLTFCGPRRTMAVRGVNETSCEKDEMRSRHDGLCAAEQGQPFIILSTTGRVAVHEAKF